MIRRGLAAAFAVFFVFVAVAQEPQSEAGKVMASIGWVHGPAKGNLKDYASIPVPQGYMFANASDVPKLMELMENPVSGKEVGFLAPEDMSWFMVFEFDPVGYVKDEDRDDLDAGAILTTIRNGTEAANEERKKRGWATLSIVGWDQEPRYDPASNNLTWAVRAQSGASQVVNHNTRILGREGVMEIALVCEPQQLAGIAPSARQLLADYSFNPGQRYAEWRKGDKIAGYGLAALITGGGVAVAAKSGLLAKILKLLAKFGVFLAAGVAAAFKKIFGSKKDPASAPNA